MNRLRQALLTALVALVVAPAAADQVYKWTDANGQVHYGDSHNGAPTAMSPIDIGDGNLAAPFDGPQTVSKEVLIYSAAWCGICGRAKAFLDRRGTRYLEYDIENDPRGRNEFRRIGGRGVPLIVVGKQRMQGFDAARLERLLVAAGL